MKQLLLARFILALKILLSLGVITALLYLTISLPLQRILTARLESALGRRATIESARFHPLRGIIARDIHIYEQDRTKEFLRIGEAVFPILILPDLKEPLIFIPSLSLNGVRLNLERQTPEDWNFDDIKTRLSKKSRGGKLAVYVRALSLRDGKISFKDNTIEPVQSEIFDPTSADMSLSFTKGLRFNLDTQIAEQKARISVGGHYQTGSQQLQMHVNAEKINLANKIPLLFPDLKMEILTAFLETLDVDVQTRKDYLLIDGKVTLQAKVKPAPDQLFNGHIDAQRVTVLRNPVKTEARLSFTTDDVLWTREPATAQGRITTRDFFVGWDNKDLLTLKGDFNLENVFLHNATGQKYQGSLFARGLTVSSRPGETSAQGDIAIENPAVFFKEDYRVFGKALGLHGLNLTWNPAGASIKTSFFFQNADAKFGSNFAITGDWQGAQGELAYQDGRWLFQGDSLFNNPRLQILGQKYRGAAVTATKTALHLQDSQTRFSASLQTTELGMVLPDKKSFTGNPTIDLDLTYDPNKKPKLEYQGAIIFDNDTFQGVPFVGEVKQVNGRVTLEPNALTTKDITVNTLNTSLRIQGGIRNFRTPSAELSVEAQNLDLQQVNTLLEKQFEHWGWTPQGTASAHARYSGSLTAFESSGLSLTAELKECALTGKNLPAPLNKISGVIDYTPEGLRWQNLSLSYLGETYTTEGSLKNFALPTVQAGLNGRHGRLSTTFKWRNGTMAFSEFSGQYFNTIFDITGDIKFQSNGRAANLKGRVDLDLEDLPTLFTLAGKKTTLPPLTGQITLNGTIDGILENLAQGRWQITAQGSEAVINGLRWQDISARLDQGGDEICRLTLNADIYGGRLNVNANSRLAQTGSPFELAAEINSLNLASMKTDTSWNNKDLAGQLTGIFHISGLMNKSETYRGKGTITIKDGLLWKFHLLTGIWRFLLIPELEEVPFTSARANFVIKNGRLITDDLLLKSRPIDLIGKGWLDFNKNLNLTVIPQFRQSEILGSLSSKKAATKVVARLAENIGVKLTGPISKPRHQKVLRADMMLKKTASSILDGAEGLMDEILNGWN